MDTLEEIAAHVQMSKTTVASYLKWLSGAKKSSKRYFRVIPHLDEDALGMHTVDVFFETPTNESLKAVELLCDEHPYTKYRARSYGGGSEVFAQFRIPKGSMHLLRRFLDTSKKKSTFKDYRLLPTENTRTLFTVPQLEFWNIESFSWDFNWNKWLKQLSAISIDPVEPPNGSKIDLLSKSDVSILSSISTNGIRRKQKDIMQELKGMGVEFTSQEFSRRMQLLKEHFILQYHVYIDSDTFDLYSNVVITANCDPDFSSAFQSLIKTRPFPFRTTLRMTDDFMFWYLRLPSGHLSKLLSILHENVENLRLSTIDYEKTSVYGIWDEAFDEERNQWRTDPRFMMCE